MVQPVPNMHRASPSIPSTTEHTSKQLGEMWHVPLWPPSHWPLFLSNNSDLSQGGGLSPRVHGTATEQVNWYHLGLKLLALL